MKKDNLLTGNFYHPCIIKFLFWTSYPHNHITSRTQACFGFAQDITLWQFGQFRKRVVIKPRNHSVKWLSPVMPTTQTWGNGTANHNSTLLFFKQGPSVNPRKSRVVCNRVNIIQNTDVNWVVGSHFSVTSLLINLLLYDAAFTRTDMKGEKC